MVTLEQVKLLDQRITRTIEYVKKVTDENILLKGKMDSYKKRINELEKANQQFKDDQSQIEEKFMSAFNRLNEIEDALGTTFNADAQAGLNKKPEAPPAVAGPASVLTVTAVKEDSVPVPVAQMYDTPEAEEPDNELDIF